ncbi:MAG TPA: nucleoside-diphosphate sugar epimerase/dehydratase [Actinomycetaceae bacterium]|nr:nucleoside-diphosphate sugar epimerase/dehydratase [Actinomycetaceae bacterium]
MRRLIFIAWDFGAWVIALFAFMLLRRDFQIADAQWASFLLYTGIAAVLQAVLGVLTHLYLGRNRIGSFSEAGWMTGLVVGVALPLGLAMGATNPDFPVGAALVLPPMAILVMAGGRAVFRMLKYSGPRWIDTTERALIYGAGDAGYQVARLVDISDEPPYRILGYVDDNHGKRFLRVRRYRVLGTGDDLVPLARKLGAEVVIMAISNASPSLIQRVSDACDNAGLKFVIIPPVREMIGGQVTLGAIREFNVVDLLGRRPVSTDVRSISHYISGRRVLVTGAGGSIGAEIAKQVHKLGAAKLICLDRDESALHAVQLELYNNGLLDTDDMVLCDIRDREALYKVFDAHRPEVVFHAAALKHLPMLERFPAEGWKTNVLGTLNVLRCAQAVGATHFVNISTDKAAGATSVLGLSKRLAERLTSWFAERDGHHFLSVRFGNVLGSRGSMLFAFKSQIEHGGPVTVTHPEVTRYFMTIPEACELVIQAGAIGHPGDVMVLDMGEPVRILDVAKRLIAESQKKIEIRFTGLRPGEKLHEELLSAREHGTPTGHPLITGVRIPALDPADVPEGATEREEILHLFDDDPTVALTDLATALDSEGLRGDEGLGGGEGLSDCHGSRDGGGSRVGHLTSHDGGLSTSRDGVAARRISPCGDDLGERSLAAERA